METTQRLFLARGWLSTGRFQRGPAGSWARTSKELLLPGEALALLVTDLPPVVRRDPLHRQLQVLLLLG